MHLALGVDLLGDAREDGVVDLQGKVVVCNKISNPYRQPFDAVEVLDELEAERAAHAAVAVEVEQA